MKPFKRLAFGIFCAMISLLTCSPAPAQTTSSPAQVVADAQPSDSSSRQRSQWGVDEAAGLRKEHWNFGAFVGGGTGLGQRTNVQMFRAGARVGRVMTGEKGRGWARGTFELDSEVAPVDNVFWSGYRNVYGFGAMPVILKWNFTSRRRIVPFAEVLGGLLWTKVNIPPGDTSQINFTPGGGGGMHMFIKPNHAITWTLRIVHISNASLGNHNPGVNSSVQGSLGYTWFKNK
jgi:hypothetical protein